MKKYIEIKVAQNVTEYEHRIIMEQVLGRKLLPNEVVHHIDGNGRNNVVSNLKVMFSSEHSKLHRDGAVLSDITKEKIGTKSTINNRSRRKLTDEEVEYIRNSIDTELKLAKLFNVSKTTIHGVKSFLVYKVH
jgi:hypothetical protein